MRKTSRLAVALGLLAGAGLAFAGVGEVLYVKARDTRFQKEPTPTSALVAGRPTLQPGDKVEWQGRDGKDPKWHKVKAGALEGYVFQSNLSKSPPSTELDSRNGGKAVDAQAFASSGAAIRGLSETGDEYAKESNAAAEAKKLRDLEGRVAQWFPNNSYEPVQKHRVAVGLEGGR